MEGKNKIIIICGPTASGKTSLAINLASKFNGEIISADSMQVYKKLDVGTAKASKEEQEQIKHYLIDILEPQEPYNVQLFVKMATDAINEICSKGKTPIIVGGTGLYIESLINGISFSKQEDNTDIKNNLQEQLQAKGKDYLYELLREIDPNYATKVHPNNTVRVLRALELYYLTGKTMTEQILNSKPKQKPYDALMIGLNFSHRELLYNQINKRVDIMVESNVIEEANYVWKNKSMFTTSAAAIGYKEFFPFFENEDGLENCIDKLKQASRNYAKRQLTWFNRMEDINWFSIDKDNVYEKAEELCENFLNGGK